MTAINFVSAKEMQQKTGFKTALGYSLPEEDTILIRKGLPKEKKKEVLEHEEEHIAKDEEGPFLGALIGAVGTLWGASKSSKAAKQATQAQVDASGEEIAFAKESRDLIRRDQAPYVSAGHTALDALMSMTGLKQAAVPVARRALPVYEQDPRYEDLPRSIGVRRSGYGRIYPRVYGGAVHPEKMYNINELGPESVYADGAYTRSSRPVTIDGKTGYVEPEIEGRVFGGAIDDTRYYKPTPTWGGDSRLPPKSYSGRAVPRENPGGVEGGYNFMTDPGYEFRTGEGIRTLERSAASKGGLLSGGFARKAIRYGQGYASNEYANVYNRIAAIAQIGGVANQTNANAALSTSRQVGGAINDAGMARASGYTARGNVYGSAINEIARLPWEDFYLGKQRGPG